MTDETTQRERLVALLAEFGITPLNAADDDWTRFDAEDTARDVILYADAGGVEGYGSFYARFEFDDAGQFKTVGVWE